MILSLNKSVTLLLISGSSGNCRAVVENVTDNDNDFDNDNDNDRDGDGDGDGVSNLVN